MVDKTDEFHPDLLATQVRILELVARGEKIDHVLRELCLSIEALLPEAVAGVTVLDRAARIFDFAVFPSLRATYAAALPGLRVVDRPGSCAVAVYEGEIITSANIAEDTRFQKEWRALNLEHGLRAIQSRPVFAPDGTSLGTFVLGFREPRPATAFDNEVVTLGAHLAGIALTAYRSHQQQDLLIKELQHRTKNIFATISALTYFTLKANDDPETIRTTLQGRIAALGHAHSLAVRHTGADLLTLIEELLAPYGVRSRVEMSGPPIELAANAAMAFSMALHELATNAVKYGALSCNEGEVSIAWDVKQDAAGEQTFVMQWSELGGPPVSPPRELGFGCTTIEKSLAQVVEGNVTLDFAPTGLMCTITAPLTERFTPMTWERPPGVVEAAE